MVDKDEFKGAVRSTVGQSEKFGGDAFRDKSTAAPARYDEAVGNAESAVGSVKYAVSRGADAVASGDISAVRNDLAKLTETISGLVQKQAVSTRDQVTDALGSVGENLSQSASVAQDTLMSMQEEIGLRARKNPWSAVAMAVLVGLILGRLI
jgi:ElaB/YqjD/DUF883 family membrane-anchored ribosome-binding protein/uncharacterized protein YjbJ (UPF0337 family)